ncbi:hypothetical protein SKAU_G00387140 [Synaphobranchus kaupii]|uniref:Uncharacterized protein n=1 Tax=Synaphobranchus kaupii TaxID=118154 RepID=A0A9Q1ID93_SYNKA|nr:hypothetical protein SKAU_G00387140 [Synaphobranchus kaupii]
MPRHYWHARMWSRRHAECMDPVLAVAHRRLYGVLRTKLGPGRPVGVVPDRGPESVLVTAPPMVLAPVRASGAGAALNPDAVAAAVPVQGPESVLERAPLVDSAPGPKDDAAPAQGRDPVPDPAPRGNPAKDAALLSGPTPGPVPGIPPFTAPAVEAEPDSAPDPVLMAVPATAVAPVPVPGPAGGTRMGHMFGPKARSVLGLGVAPATVTVVVPVAAGDSAVLFHQASKSSLAGEALPFSVEGEDLLMSEEVTTSTEWGESPMQEGDGVNLEPWVTTSPIHKRGRCRERIGEKALRAGPGIHLENRYEGLSGLPGGEQADPDLDMEVESPLSPGVVMPGGLDEEMLVGPDLGGGNTRPQCGERNERRVRCDPGIEAALLDGVTARLGGDEVQALEAVLTLDEVTAALRSMRDRRSPWHDGLPKEFYWAFWDLLGPDLLEGGDCAELKNWRPLTLLTADYKVLAKVATLRLKQVMSGLVSEDQTCGVPGRSCSWNLGLIRDTLAWVEDRNLPLAVRGSGEKNWEGKLALVRSRLGVWTRQRLSLTGRVVVVRALVESVSHKWFYFVRFYLANTLRHLVPLTHVAPRADMLAPAYQAVVRFLRQCARPLVREEMLQHRALYAALAFKQVVAPTGVPLGISWAKLSGGQHQGWCVTCTG